MLTLSVIYAAIYPACQDFICEQIAPKQVHEAFLQNTNSCVVL